MARRTSPTDTAERVTRQASATGARTANEWLDAQAQLFEQFDHVATQWLERRREALDATRHSIDQMRSCEQVGDFLRVQHEWVEGSMRRLTEDMTEFARVAFAVPQVAASRFSQTAATMGRGLSKAQEDFLSQAREVAD